jgi:CDP-diacylglycerol--glycerol-3-phosphate 3-phosphatidyltransferase
MSPLYRQLPNSLTMLRLVIAGGFFATLNLYRFPDHNALWANIAIVLFIAAAFTDWLDGYLARRWNVESVFGRIMDPFCDKVLILGGFIYLAGPRFAIAPAPEADALIVTNASGVYPWMVVVIFARELLVTSIRGALESRGISGEAKLVGKAKMVLQSIMIPVVIFIAVNLNPMEHTWAAWVRDVLVYATVLVTLWSGLPYIAGLKKLLRLSTAEPHE